MSATPRCHKRHQRYEVFSHMRHSQQELAFLLLHASRLGTTVNVLFYKLTKYTADEIAAAPNLAALP
jgi:hypothetical protein